MQYRIICYGPRLVGYGPFDSVSEARNYADKYLQDYRTEIIPYEVIEANVAMDDAVNVILMTEGGMSAHDF